MKQNESDNTRLYECNLSRCGEKCSYPDCHLTSQAEFAVNPDFWISAQDYPDDDSAETNQKGIAHLWRLTQTVRGKGRN